jgi:hypothetical protein
LALDFRGLQVLQQVTKDEFFHPNVTAEQCIKTACAQSPFQDFLPARGSGVLKTLNFLCSFPADFFQ